MLARSLFVLGLFVLLSAAVWLALGHSSDTVAALEQVAKEPDPVPVALDPLSAPRASKSERETAQSDEASVLVDEVAAAATTEPIDESFDLRARVLDLQGRPVADVNVRQVGEQRDAQSDREGVFQLRIVPGKFGTVLRANDADWTTVHECEVAKGGLGRDHFIVVAPALRIAGTVVDEAGKAVQSARVGVGGLRDLADSFPLPLDGNRLVRFEVSSEADGSFVIESAPQIRSDLQFRLFAKQAGFVEGSEPLPSYATDDVRFVLERAVDATPKLTGIVLLPNGSPAVDASVKLGFNFAKATADGSFAMSLEHAVAGDDALVAGLKDYGPAFIADYGATLNATLPQLPQLLVLQLGPKLVIRGVLLDDAGAPAQKWQIGLSDATVISSNQYPPELAETVGTGETTVNTKSDGSFRLRNLLAREYTLIVRSRATLQTFYTRPIAAGTADLVLRVPSDGLHAEVNGIVVDRAGHPIEHVNVAVGLYLHRGDNGYSATSVSGVRTNESGQFTLRDVPTEHVHFQVSGDSITGEHFEWMPEMNPEALVFEVARRRYFRVALDRADSASMSYGFVDAEGNEMMATSYEVGSSSSMSRLSLSPGLNPVLAISEDARKLQVFDAQRERIHEQPVWFDDSDVTVIRIELP